MNLKDSRRRGFIVASDEDAVITSHHHYPRCLVAIFTGVTARSHNSSLLRPISRQAEFKELSNWIHFAWLERLLETTMIPSSPGG